MTLTPFYLDTSTFLALLQRPPMTPRQVILKAGEGLLFSMPLQYPLFISSSILQLQQKSLNLRYAKLPSEKAS